MAAVHGKPPHTSPPVFSTSDSYDADYYGIVNITKEPGNRSYGNDAERKKDGADAGEKNGGKKKRRLVCDLCNKTFNHVCSLNRHKLNHTGYKPFVCELCSKACATLSGLKTHRHTHTGQKPFACDVCTMAFSQTGHLKRHKLTHTKQKQFVCDVCDKAFTRADNLKKHMLIHTGHKKFVCDVCKKAFTQSGHLKRHMKKIHAENTQESSLPQ